MANHMLATIFLNDAPPLVAPSAMLLKSAKVEELYAVFAGPPRSHLADPWVPRDDARLALEANRLAFIACGATVEDVMRILCVVRAADLVPHPLELVSEWYEGGGVRQRVAVLRALSLLPRPCTFLPIALRAARSREDAIFRAIALDNPYPAAFFPNDAFDALVEDLIARSIKLSTLLGLMERQRTLLAGSRKYPRASASVATAREIVSSPDSS